MSRKAGKRDEQRKLKLCVLERVKEKKAVLFGQFSPSLTKEMRSKAWIEIGTYAKSIGVLPNGKEASYIRDVWWPNVRKLSMVSKFRFLPDLLSEEGA